MGLAAQIMHFASKESQKLTKRRLIMEVNKKVTTELRMAEAQNYVLLATLA